MFLYNLIRKISMLNCNSDIKSIINKKTKRNLYNHKKINRIKGNVAKGKIIKSVVSISIAFAFVSSNTTFAIPADLSKNSKAAIMMDYKTGRYIYFKNESDKYAIASMSKLMTLLVAFDQIKSGNVKFEDQVPIIREDTQIIGSNMKLKPNISISLGQLFQGMMVVSANDAALSISRHCGGSVDSFVNMMNEKAKEIGMNDTVFYSPNGLPAKKDGKEVENTSTPKDMMTLCKYLLDNYKDWTLSMTKSRNFSGSTIEKENPNTNPLFSDYKEVDGLKTGFTDSAGYCLAFTSPIGRDTKDTSDNRIIGITMGNPTTEDRHKNSYNMLTYVYKNYSTRKLHKAKSRVRTVKLNGINKLNLSLGTRKNVLAFVENSEKLKESYEYYKVKGIKNGKKVGVLKIVNQEGKVVSRYDLIVTGDPSEFSPLNKVRYAFSTLVNSFRYMNKDHGFDTVTSTLF